MLEGLNSRTHVQFLSLPDFQAQATEKLGCRQEQRTPYAHPQQAVENSARVRYCLNLISLRSIL